MDVHQAAAADVMIPLVEIVDQGSEPLEAFRIIDDKGVWRLFVVDERDKPVGLVSPGDVPQHPN